MKNLLTWAQNSLSALLYHVARWVTIGQLCRGVVAGAFKRHSSSLCIECVVIHLKNAIPLGVVKSIAFCFPGSGCPRFTSRLAVGSSARSIHLLTIAVPQKYSMH